MTLEQRLADLRERVTMLRVEGHPVQSASLERARALLRREEEA